MSISAVSGPTSSQYADALRGAVATRAQAKPAAPVDSDGDRDGSSAVKGRLDVKM
jgi:hypothetical protein